MGWNDEFLDKNIEPEDFDFEDRSLEEVLDELDPVFEESVRDHYGEVTEETVRQGMAEFMQAMQQLLDEENDVDVPDVPSVTDSDDN